MKPTPDLMEKFVRLGLSPDVERIYATIILLEIQQNLEEIARTRAIVDTGAIFSLMPRKFLQKYGNIPTQSHSIWGIINKEPCHLSCDLGMIPIQLVDEKEHKSPVINVPIAFAKNDEVPILLGMKSMLTNYPFQFNNQSLSFSIDFT